MKTYEPAPLAEPAILNGGYAPPEISEPIVLCAQGPAESVQLDPVILTTGYVPPDIDRPVILCGSGFWLDADIPTAVPPAPMMAGAGRQAFIGGMAASIPPPALPAPTLDSTALLAATLAAGLSPVAVPAPALTSSISQNLDLPDDDSASVRQRHRRRVPNAALGLELQQRHGKTGALPLAVEHQSMEKSSARLSALQARMILFQRPMGQIHQHGLDVGGSIATPHAEAIRTRASTREHHQHGLYLQGAAALPYAETIKRQSSKRMAEWQALPTARGLSVGQRNGWSSGARIHLRWAHAEKPGPGYWLPDWWADIYKPPGLNLVMPCIVGYVPRPLRCPVILGAGYAPQPPCPIQPGDSTIIVPIREVYYVINTFTLTLLDGTPVPTAEFNANIDADSWTWSWSARIPGYALSLVRPDSSTRVELLADINGEPLRVLVENIQRERRFGESWLRVSGRGRAAFLADPLAPVLQYSNATPMTARQCLEQALTENGVPIGWTVDWQIEDWQIPAGLWSHSGTWIDAAKRIADAGGAYVQGHNTAETLRILPRYPIAPWNWADATPDIQLPEDVVEVEGIEWQEKPNYNAVWVHGAEQGRADRIIRTGSGGDYPAPTVVDSLATDPAMTRQRGLAVLGDTGKQAMISLRLPVLPETGLIHPGKLIEYAEQGNRRRGLVRSLSVAQNHPDLWQTIGVETHE